MIFLKIFSVFEYFQKSNISSPGKIFPGVATLVRTDCPHILVLQTVSTYRFLGQFPREIFLPHCHNQGRYINGMAIREVK